MKIIDLLLDFLKKILVRFKNAKFGLTYIVNMFRVPGFLLDRRVSILSKLKVVISLGIGIAYLIAVVDILPVVFLGPFGLIDDIIIIVWSLGIVSEEIEKHRKRVREEKDPNVIEGVNYRIYDEE